MTFILSFVRMGIGTFWGRMIGVAVLAFGALTANNYYQRAKGASAERTKIVEKTNKKAKERNAKASKVRKRNPVSGAASRLRKQYGTGAN